MTPGTSTVRLGSSSVDSMRLEGGRVGAGVVAVVLGRVRLDRGLGRTGLRLGVGVTGLVPLCEERRDGDCGQDADDEHHDQELDEGETLFVGPRARSLSSIVTLLRVY